MEKNGERKDASRDRIWPFIFTPNESTTGHERESNTNSGSKLLRAPALCGDPRLRADSFPSFLLLEYSK